MRDILFYIFIIVPISYTLSMEPPAKHSSKISAIQKEVRGDVTSWEVNDKAFLNIKSLEGLGGYIYAPNVAITAPTNSEKSILEMLDIRTNSLHINGYKQLPSKPYHQNKEQNSISDSSVPAELAKAFLALQISKNQPS